jgi:hypothetical protein
MVRSDFGWTRPRRRDVLASLFQAVAGRALGGPVTTTSVVAVGADGQGRGPACAALFGSYNGQLFSSDRHGPCGLGPDAATPMPIQLSPATAAVADGDDVRARFLVSRPDP